MLFEVVLFSKAIIEGFAINVFSLIDWTVLILFTALTVLYWIYLWEVNKAYDEMDVEVEDS